MNNMVKRYQVIISASLLAFSSMIGIPIKSYVEHVKDDIKELGNNEATCPTYWNPYMSKTYARGFIAMEYPSWGRAEWRALLKLWGKESAWNHTADNPESTAYGVAQVLNTKPGTPAPLQIEKGLSYIKHRYDRPSIAWAHWRKHGWY